MMQSHEFLLSNLLTVHPVSSNNSFSVRICCPNAYLNRLHSRKSTITCAGSTNKTLIRLVRFATSNLHYVLPEPLNSVVREFSVGSGGGGSRGSWNGFGWGGFDGGGGRRRRVNKKSELWFWGLVTVCWLGFWGLILAGELELNYDAVLGALCLSMFLVLVRNGCVPEWVLGFCSGGVVVGFLLHKKDELQKLVKGFKAMGILRRRRG